MEMHFWCDAELYSVEAINWMPSYCCSLFSSQWQQLLSKAFDISTKIRQMQRGCRTTWIWVKSHKLLNSIDIDVRYFACYWRFSMHVCECMYSSMVSERVKESGKNHHTFLFLIKWTWCIVYSFFLLFAGTRCLVYFVCECQKRQLLLSLPARQCC